MSSADVPDGFRPADFRNGFLDATGPYFTRRDDGIILVGLRVTKGHINHIGLAHGGMLTTLADVALSLKVNRAEKPPLPVATVNLTTNFLSGAKLDDWVVATARIDRMGKRMAYTSGSIRVDDRLLMTMTGVFAILRKG